LEKWGKNAPLRVPVRVLNDGTLSNETRLGAIGDLDFAIRECGLDVDILMLASDNLFDTGLDGFVRFCQAKCDQVCVGLYDIKNPKLAAKKFGVLEVDGAGQVTGIEEKPEAPKSSFIGMGIYFFPKKTLGLTVEYLRSAEAKDAPGHYVRWLMGKTPIFGFLFSGLWYDIGDLKALEEARKKYDKQT